MCSAYVDRLLLSSFEFIKPAAITQLAVQNACYIFEKDKYFSQHQKQQTHQAENKSEKLKNIWLRILASLRAADTIGWM